MPAWIERHGHTVDGQGFIHYDDQPITYEQADHVAGKRLDRRRNYCVIDGAVHEAAHYTMACTGCWPPITCSTRTPMAVPDAVRR